MLINRLILDYYKNYETIVFQIFYVGGVFMEFLMKIQSAAGSSTLFVVLLYGGGG